MKINNSTYIPQIQSLRKTPIKNNISFCSIRKETDKDTFTSTFKKNKNLDFNSLTGRLVEEDMRLIQKAKEQGIAEEDLFVREYNCINGGMEKSATGDVFKVKDEKNIFLKLSDDDYMQLDIDKKTYMKLFPPVKRFLSEQRSSGDCYLVSVLNQMIANPNSRKYIYSCFENDEEGNIKVKFPDSKTLITLKPDETIHDLGVASNKCAKGALGIQLLEYLYKEDVLNDRIKFLETYLEADKEQVSIFWEANRRFFDIKGVKPDDYDGIKNALSGNLFKLYANNKSLSDVVAKREVILTCLSDIEKITQELDEINSDPQYFEKNAGDGGFSLDVCKKFGIEAVKTIPLSDKVLNNTLITLLNNPSEQENYIITTATRRKKTLCELLHLPTPIVSNHVYGFEVVKDKKGMPAIKVTNPWDTCLANKQKITELTPDKFVKYFECLWIAGVNQDSLFLVY